jgi:stearoyl-CoA desaturase (delta-9 desaturase)
MTFFKNYLKTPLTLLSIYLASFYVLRSLFGEYGFVGEIWTSNVAIKMVVYVVLMTHITISCMSISFHRYHTHKGVILNKYIDIFMQTWLWIITSMSKRDWVSVHQYHHIHSDTEKDPHSPVTKGLAHVLFLGVFDYTKAKSNPEVLKLRAKLPENKMEAFFAKNLFLGPSIGVFLFMIVFGVKWGSLLSVVNFLISPIFAVGGVNALAHYFGYRNHRTNENSRNLGFIAPLNFMICGELDHNNHHAHQKSCSFRHKWYEFDIGYFYIKLMKSAGLAEVKSVYNTKTFKVELARRAQKLMDQNAEFKKRCEELSQQLNQNIQDLQDQVRAYLEGKKVKLSQPLKEYVEQLKERINQDTVFVTALA